MNVADPSEGGGVLILLSDRLSATVDFDGAGPVGQLLGRYLPALICEKSMQQPDGHRRRGAEPRASGGNVGKRRNLNATSDARHVHSLADQFMLEVFDSRNDLLSRVVHVDVVIESLLDDDIDVLVDGGVEYPAAVLAVVTGQVRSSADQPDPKWRLGDDHDAVLPPLSSRASSSATGLPISRK